jgi:hypothetical protein
MLLCEFPVYLTGVAADSSSLGCDAVYLGLVGVGGMITNVSKDRCSPSSEMKLPKDNFV